MAARGIPLDAAAIMSTVLEGILYGEYCIGLIRPMPSTKLGYFRLFTPHVCGCRLGIDLQTSYAGSQSPHCCSGHYVVHTKHRG